jgi:hypothetical protein
MWEGLQQSLVPQWTSGWASSPGAKSKVTEQMKRATVVFFLRQEMIASPSLRRLPSQGQQASGPADWSHLARIWARRVWSSMG